MPKLRFHRTVVPDSVTQININEQQMSNDREKW